MWCMAPESCKVCECVYASEGSIAVSVNSDEATVSTCLLGMLDTVCECSVVCVRELGSAVMSSVVVGVVVLWLEDSFVGSGSGFDGHWSLVV